MMQFSLKVATFFKRLFYEQQTFGMLQSLDEIYRSFHAYYQPCLLSQEPYSIFVLRGLSTGIICLFLLSNGVILWVKDITPESWITVQRDILL